MRLALPTRVSVGWTFGFSLLFFCVQQFQHTDLIFSLLYFAFVILTVLTFNFAEGFTRLTGAYTFWIAILIVIFGVFWKAVVGEPADSNLMVPRLDMTLDACTMVMLLAVTLLNRKMDFRSKGIGAGFVGPNFDLSVAGLGCLVTAVTIIFVGYAFGLEAGGVLSALSQVNFFFPLGIILGTAGAIKDSGGRRSVNIASGLSLFLFTLQGLISFGKQGMLTPALCWVLGAFYMRLRVRLIHVIVMTSVVVISVAFVGPLSQSRDLVEGIYAPDERLAVIWHQITHWKEFQEHVQSLEQRASHDSGAPSYYDGPQGSLIERLNMMVPDDHLNAYTARGNYAGMAPIIEWFSNAVPRFLYPGKTNDYTGNYFAHKSGGYVSAEDTTTGISFSPISCAYQCMGWGGIFWLMPGIWILLFTSVDFVAGDLSKYPWGLLVIVWFAHEAPESMLSGMIYYISYGNLGMLLAIIVCTRLAPIIGSLVAGKAVTAGPGPVGRARITPRTQVVE